MTPFDPDAAEAAARDRTGLDDLGPVAYREGLEVLCASLAGEARLNAVGEAVVGNAVVGALANRLRVYDWVARHPAVAAEEIRAPWIVVGHFRAGTTFLAQLLEQDPRNRPLLRWEANDSAPPSTGEHRRDPRVEAERAGSAALDAINPRIRIVQGESPDGATECIGLLSQDFRSLLWEALANVPTYGEWQHTTDHRSAYAYHHLALRVLQSGGVRGRWLLKSPHHALHLESLLAEYPDARIVLVHRDPLVLCASVCSLITTLTGTFTDADHRPYIARHWPDVLDASIRAVDAFRAAHPTVAVHELHYAELAADPVAAVEQLYAAAGDTLAGPVADALRAHAAGHPKGRHGVHRYAPEEFGLDVGALADRFAGYVERTGVALEMARPR